MTYYRGRFCHYFLSIYLLRMTMQPIRLKPYAKLGTGRYAIHNETDFVTLET